MSFRESQDRTAAPIAAVSSAPATCRASQAAKADVQILQILKSAIWLSLLLVIIGGGRVTLEHVEGPKGTFSSDIMSAKSVWWVSLSQPSLLQGPLWASQLEPESLLVELWPLELLARSPLQLVARWAYPLQQSSMAKLVPEWPGVPKWRRMARLWLLGPLSLVPMSPLSEVPLLRLVAQSPQALVLQSPLVVWLWLYVRLRRLQSHGPPLRDSHQMFSKSMHSLHLSTSGPPHCDASHNSDSRTCHSRSLQMKTLRSVLQNTKTFSKNCKYKHCAPSSSFDMPCFNNSFVTAFLAASSACASAIPSAMPTVLAAS